MTDLRPLDVVIEEMFSNVAALQSEFLQELDESQWTWELNILMDLIQDYLVRERRLAKIAVLTDLAHKNKPTLDGETHPEFIKGWLAMQGKVKFELQRLKKLKEQST